MPLPAELDRRSRADGLTLRDFRRAIPAECYKLTPFRSWLALGRSLCVGAGAVWALSRLTLTPGPDLLWQLPVLLLLWLVLACALVGLFVLGHDCGHGAFSPRPWVNSLVGHLCMSPLLTGFHSWRLAHGHHHAFTQLRREDTDWPERTVTREEYALLSPAERARVRLGYGSPAGLLLGFWVGVGRRLLVAAGYPQMRLSRREKRQALLSTVLMVAGTGGVVALLWRLGGPWGVVKYYGGPVLIGATLGALITLLHHSSADALVFDREDWTPVRGQVLSTFQVRFPGLLEWLWLDINIHLPHHLAPRIPWYHLRAASEAIRRAYPEYHQERPFRLGDLRLLWSRPVLLRHHDGYYAPAALE